MVVHHQISVNFRKGVFIHFKTKLAGHPNLNLKIASIGDGFLEKRVLSVLITPVPDFMASIHSFVRTLHMPVLDFSKKAVKSFPIH